MSDTTLRGKVLWIGASNRPDLIDAALKRAGRLDMSIPFFPPDKKAIEDILKIHLKIDEEQTDITIELSENEKQEIINELNGNKPKTYFTGAEIELIVNEVIRKATNTSEKIINYQLFKDTLSSYEPSRENYEKIIFSTLKEVSFTNYLPEKWKEMRKEIMQYSSYEQWKRQRN